MKQPVVKLNIEYENVMIFNFLTGFIPCYRIIPRIPLKKKGTHAISMSASSFEDLKD